MPPRSVGAIRARISTRPIRAWVRDQLLHATDREDLATFREDLARRYLQGSGIEIGALHRPLRLPPAAHVRYVDVLSREGLLATHTSAVYGNPKWVVETDVIDDCQRLQTFADGSLDFVVANHILEHTEDPIAALENLVRVLRPSGILFLTLPDARRTFDGLRPRTSVEHLRRDHREGPHASRYEHYREWAKVECLPEEQSRLGSSSLRRMARDTISTSGSLRASSRCSTRWDCQHPSNWPRYIATSSPLFCAVRRSPGRHRLTTHVWPSFANRVAKPS